MARPRVRPLTQVPCAYCGKILTRALDKRSKKLNAYCNMEHRNLGYLGKEPIKKHSTKALISEYQRIFQFVGHIPDYEDLRSHSRYHLTIYQKRFGTLDNLASIALDNFDCNKPDTPWSVENLSPADGGWLAGLAAGESCFRIAGNRRGTYAAIWHIQLRADDAAVLNEIKRLWNIPHPLRVWDRKYDRARGINAGDGISLSIRDIPTLVSRLIPTFDRYPMRAKKDSDYALFRRGVTLLQKRRQGGRRFCNWSEDERKEMSELHDAIVEVRRYKITLAEVMEKFKAIRIGS